MTEFTSDWVSEHVDNWAVWLAPFQDQPNVQLLEVGSFEGRSGLWFLNHILTGAGSCLISVDISANDALLANLQPHILQGKVVLHNAASFDALRSPPLIHQKFDIIYIDACHRSIDVLQDAVLSFPLLKVGGIMLFDDYEWDGRAAELERPKTGIDAFLSVYRECLEVVAKAYQVAICKVSDHETA